MNEFGLGIETDSGHIRLSIVLQNINAVAAEFASDRPKLHQPSLDPKGAQLLVPLLRVVLADLKMWVPETFLKAAVKKCFRALTNLQSVFRTVYTKRSTFLKRFLRCDEQKMRLTVNEVDRCDFRLLGVLI